jgi:hypothetical protein
LLPALAVTLLAGSWAGGNAWLEGRERRAPLDVDGWGHLVTRLDTEGREFGALFRDPSLWKGPIVPFVFGLAYYVAPHAWSILALNALAFALAAFVYCRAFQLLGAPAWMAAVAVVGWVVYLPHRYVFGYYYAEPLVSLLSAVLLWLAARASREWEPWATLACGVTAAILVLARAPFLPVVVGLGLWIAARSRGAQQRVAWLYALGFALAYAPWPIRNRVAEGQFVPFTTEGGKIFFQGTYLPGDDVTMNELRRMPEFRVIERGEEGRSAVGQYSYWQTLALAQLRADPAGQVRLFLRKALRFWTYLPAGSWMPSWKTGTMAAVLLPMGGIGFVRHRRTPLAQLCALWVAGLWLFHALIHAELRYNFPVLPTLMVLALLAFAGLPAARKSGAGAAATAGVV